MYEFKTRPYEHQKTALRMARDKPFFAFLMEMGTGKTKVVIDEIGILYTEYKISRAVILAPKGVYMNWPNTELPIHLGVDADVIEWRPGGGNKSHQKRLLAACEPSPRLQILVINTEALSSGTKGINYLKKFIGGGDCYAAVDESTFIKNQGSNRTKKVIECGRLAKYRRIMTGSPVTSSPLDLFSQFDFLENGSLGSRSYYAFRARYAVMQRKDFGGRSVDVVVGYKNIEELTEKIAPHSYRVMKSDCLDLPDKVYMKRDVEMTAEQLQAYAEMRANAFTEIGDGFANAQSAITILLRLHQITCGHITDADGDVHTLKSNRVSEMMRVVEEVSGDVIIWARYRHDIRSIVEELRRVYGDDSVAEFHGGNTKTREGDAERFKNSNACRFMVSNQQSGGYGNTWINATTTIYFSNDYDLEKRLQSEDRNHRSGQRSKVTYYDLVCPGTVDEKILAALRKKINISDTILGDGFREWIV